MPPNALRYTWATFLQRNGVGQCIAMKLMRQSDIKLTAKVYTDESQLPVYDAIKNLPRLKSYALKYAQILGAEGQNGWQVVATSEGTKTQQTLANGGDCRGLSLVDGEEKMERAKGFEPSTFTLAR